MRGLLFLLSMLLVTITVQPAHATTLAPVAPVMPCAALRGFDPALAGYPAQVTEAAPMTDGGNAFCRVRGYISPQIKFEVRLPEKGWTQRYLQTGCGGLCGHLEVRAPQRTCPALTRGEFAIASTDMGHDGQGGAWGASDQQLRVDFGYRGVHATALVAKALIRRYFGQAARYSYFSGCSDGGREALMEAQRYPDDFDGIAAGAPAFNFLVQNSLYHGWNARTQLADRNGVIPAVALAPAPGPGGPPGGPMATGGPAPAAGPRLTPLMASDLPILHAAAIAACDAQDGVKDGLISDPLVCRFDPHTAQCRAGASTGCLSKATADAAAEIYAGAHDAAGRKLVVGALMPGSELSWGGVFVPRDGERRVGSLMFASDMIPWLGFPKPLGPGWTLNDFQFTVASLKSLDAMHGIYDASEPNLAPFAARRGKLLMWHGWSDPHISPTNSIAYAQAVADQIGAARADAMLRLFIVPGMYHCGDGDGLTSIDVLTPLMAWTEDGQAPDRVVASRDAAAAAAGMGRPVFAWPAVATLTAGADPDAPQSWTRAAPATPPKKLYDAWEGASLFKTGYMRDCGFDGERWVCKPAR